MEIVFVNNQMTKRLKTVKITREKTPCHFFGAKNMEETVIYWTENTGGPGLVCGEKSGERPACRTWQQTVGSPHAGEVARKWTPTTRLPISFQC
jgi:hypothetical protein